jgi:hypothetical protein
VRGAAKAVGLGRDKRNCKEAEDDAKWTLPGWLFVGSAIAVGVSGLALVLSAPLNGSARTGLGLGLITGLIVGVAVAAIQWTVESRRVAGEQQAEDQQHGAMSEVARSRLGTLVAI